MNMQSNKITEYIEQGIIITTMHLCGLLFSEHHRCHEEGEDAFPFVSLSFLVFVGLCLSVCVLEYSCS